MRDAKTTAAREKIVRGSIQKMAKEATTVNSMPGYECTVVVRRTDPRSSKMSKQKQSASLGPPLTEPGFYVSGPQLEASPQHTINKVAFVHMARLAKSINQTDKENKPENGLVYMRNVPGA